MRGSKPKLQNRAGYSIPHQRDGARITYWPDPRGPGHGECWWGTVLSHFGDSLNIAWDSDSDHFEVWDGRECKYRVERGQMRFIPPPKERRIRIPDSEMTCKVCGKPRTEKCGCPRPGALKPEEWGSRTVPALLTPYDPHDMMDISIGGNAPNDGKGQMMSKRKATPVIDDELDELEELATVADNSDELEGSGDMLTAKAAASKLGTDGRTLRKFLRKKHGTVGQGQRWEIDANDIDALKAEFDAWGKGSKADPKPKTTKPKADADEAPAPDAELDELEEIESLDMEDMEELED